ncbi:unnamed protein product [Phytophthora fragariaefolia]|uniref:Unnamed protein product n=1 Tax=Phytophthora fragariaefolia TaxID=1490495 RepID=A0A9W6X992_9STRA|nr:unnamed protein product [Phytophthora fragariaefolia]
MASGFWVVPMTDRARLISAFITPFGLFEWLRMPFGLRNAPQIYQRLIDKALYGFKYLSRGCESNDVFTDDEPDQPGVRSVLEGRLYIDDILIEGESWDDLCEKVERLLEACEKWHLSPTRLWHGCSDVKGSKADESLHVVSFDGSAKPKRVGGAFSAIVWKLPGWDIVRAKSGYGPDLTVNETEYQGMLLGCSLLETVEVSRVIVCVDSNLAIRQMRGEMECKSLGLRLLNQRACRALQRQGGVDVRDPQELQDLVTLNRLDEVTRRSSPDEDSPIHDPERKTGSLSREQKKPTEETNYVARVRAVVTRSTVRQQVTPGSEAPGLRTQVPSPPQERIVQQIRLERIRVAQDEEVWMANLKKFLIGDMDTLFRREARNCSKLADRYDVDEGNLLYYRPGEADVSERESSLKLVIPETIRKDFLHHYHASLEGGHQGVGRTYQRVRRHFHWPGIVASVQRFVGECADCETDKGRPTIRGESPGNIVSTYPIQVVAMDHIPSLPVSYKGNTELLVWVDLFSGFVIVRDNASRPAQTVAEAYEEAVFRGFGASETIRHDQEPGFMSDFFKASNKLIGQRQRAMLAYRPQANGAAERMVQTITRAIKMYITDVDQRDWDEPQLRLELELIQAAVEARAEHQNEVATGHQIEVGPQYGPFRATAMVGTCAARLETDGIAYQLHPLVHISKLKAVPVFPTRPETRLTVPVDDRFDFDEELLPEDSWEPGNLGDDVFEVDKIMGMREGSATRYERILREFEVKWKGYPDPTWVDE